MKLLVCGAAGFIGSTFVELRVREHGDDVTVLDKLTYAGRRENLREVESEIRFVEGAIESPQLRTVSRRLTLSAFRSSQRVRREGSYWTRSLTGTTNLVAFWLGRESRRHRGLRVPPVR